MEEIKVDEGARENLKKEYPPNNLILDSVAIYGFLTVWSIVGWFLAGMLILLRIESPQPIPPQWILVFAICVILTAVFGAFTARSARRQRKLHTHGK